VNLPRLNPYYRASLVLIGAAVILITLAIVTNQRDITTAAVVLSALVCLVTGVFLATLSSGEPLDVRYVSLLPVQGSINLARLGADLGISGNAVMLPAGKDGRIRTVQFNPVSDYDGEAVPVSGNSFVAGPDAAGLVTVPSGEPLFLELRKQHQLAIPPDPDALPDLIREVGVDLLEVADRVRTEQEERTVTVTMEGYRLIGGCMALATESPRCCSTHPCPVCSLIACLLAEGLGTVVQVERCSPDAGQQSVTAVFCLLPSR
jgi:hypothetical protein